MYLRNRSLPSGSKTRSRGRLGSSGVKTVKTDESIDSEWPPLLFLAKISEKNRGLTVFIESQQGIRNATGLLPGIWLKQVDAVVVGASRRGEIALRPERARVGQGVAFDRDALQPSHDWSCGSLGET